MGPRHATRPPRRYARRRMPPGGPPTVRVNRGGCPAIPGGTTGTAEKSLPWRSRQARQRCRFSMERFSMNHRLTPLLMLDNLTSTRTLWLRDGCLVAVAADRPRYRHDRADADAAPTSRYDAINQAWRSRCATRPPGSPSRGPRVAGAATGAVGTVVARPTQEPHRGGRARPRPTQTQPSPGATLQSRPVQAPALKDTTLT